ncbi:hypothetical protein C8R45DRAFT_1157822 [Mycena sanguinolenta]|nr:hypothetical protein C8R45DRAFT_1157822 [Mycena sanguinolenta]
MYAWIRYRISGKVSPIPLVNVGEGATNGEIPLGRKVLKQLTTDCFRIEAEVGVGSKILLGAQYFAVEIEEEMPRKLTRDEFRTTPEVNLAGLRRGKSRADKRLEQVLQSPLRLDSLEMHEADLSSSQPTHHASQSFVLISTAETHTTLFPGCPYCMISVLPKLPPETYFYLATELDSRSSRRQHPFKNPPASSVTSSISTLLCEVTDIVEPRQMDSILNHIFASLTLPRLQCLLLGCDVYPGHMLEFPQAQFLGLSEPSDLCHSLHTLHIAEVRIVAGDLLQILAVLDGLQYLEIGDTSERLKHRIRAHERDDPGAVVLPRRTMTCAPAQNCLVPRLSYFARVSRFVVTDSVLVDFAASRVARLSSSWSSFHVRIHAFPDTNNMSCISACSRVNFGSAHNPNGGCGSEQNVRGSPTGLEHYITDFAVHFLAVGPRRTCSSMKVLSTTGKDLIGTGRWPSELRGSVNRGKKINYTVGMTDAPPEDE